jgi:hypothetical protein
VRLAVPATGVAPDKTPPLDRLNPTAAKLLAPEVTDHVCPVPVPPAAANVCEYATPAKPTGSGDVVVIASPDLIVTVKVPVALFPTESVTFTVNVADPATGVVPASTPALDKLNPTAVKLLAPEVTVQV